MMLRYLAFSDKGEALAVHLAEVLGGEVSRCSRPLSLAEWTGNAFLQAQGLVFVGAAGIAVRAVAPFVKNKVSDPAVVVVDECGRFAVPILSGHLGGANDLARDIAGVCGAAAVITTATDANGVFAVDEWARRQDCRVLDTGKIKEISSAVLAGKTVRVFSPWPVLGDCPAGVALAENSGDCDVRLDFRVSERDALRLVPRVLVLGIGCRKGTPQEALEDAFSALLVQSGVCAEAVYAAASIDLKRGEAGLLDFCAAHSWDCRFYSAEQLKAVSGTFTSSGFVNKITGVDNVCERSAVLSSGGILHWKKSAGNGVTMALAQRPYAPDWRWLSDGK